MDATTVDAVRSLGFPVVSALALGFWTYYQDKEARRERAEFLRALGEHRDGLARLIAVIDRLTLDVREVRLGIERRE